MKRTPLHLLLRARIIRALSFAEVQQAIGLPPTDTVKFFNAKDYATQAHWDELWQQEHGRFFTVTKMLDADLLTKVRQSLADVLANGGTFEQWKAAIVPTLKAHDWYGKVPGDLGHTGVDHPIFVGDARLRTIFNTNIRTAQAAGRWASIQKAKAYRPYLMYVAVHDNRTRPLHRLWGGLDDGKPIILPVDHPCWAIYFPPCGWGCRCGVLQLSERDLQRRGLSVTTDAELVAKGWLTPGGAVGGKKTAYRRSDGTIEKVPAGVDPGFAYNPGEDFFEALNGPASAGPIDARTIVSSPDQPPMPAPRPVPESMLLPASISDEETVSRFIGAFDGDGPSDGTTVLYTDVIGQPVVISDAFFYRGGNSANPSKLSSDRREAMLLLAETIKDPDEIWIRWEDAKQADGTPYQRLSRYYVSRFEIDGKVYAYMVQTTFGTNQYGKAGGSGVTAYPPKTKSYLTGDRIRSGTRVYYRK